MAETTTRAVTIGGQRFELRKDRVERAMRRILPEPVRSHFVVVSRRRFPPKQVIEVLTGLDRADFTTHQARRTLMRLGFPAGRQDRPSRARLTGPAPEGADAQSSSAEALRPFIGQWVAVRGDDVLVAADDPRQVVGWLARHDQAADSMFRVPEDELAASGLAPL
jgi:hypothetical protein